MKKFALSILFVMGIFAVGASFASAQMNDSGNPMVGGAANARPSDAVDPKNFRLSMSSSLSDDRN